MSRSALTRVGERAARVVRLLRRPRGCSGDISRPERDNWFIARPRFSCGRRQRVASAERWRASRPRARCLPKDPSAGSFVPAGELAVARLQVLATPAARGHQVPAPRAASLRLGHVGVVPCAALLFCAMRWEDCCSDSEAFFAGPLRLLHWPDCDCDAALRLVLRGPAAASSLTLPAVPAAPGDFAGLLNGLGGVLREFLRLPRLPPLALGEIEAPRRSACRGCRPACRAPS